MTKVELVEGYQAYCEGTECSLCAYNGVGNCQVAYAMDETIDAIRAKVLVAQNEAQQLYDDKIAEACKDYDAMTANIGVINRAKGMLTAFNAILEELEMMKEAK